MIATVTQFHLKRWRSYGSFSRYTYDAFKQAQRSDGIVHIKIRPFRLMTLTVWKNREAMLAYRNSGAHLTAMKKSASFGKISSTTWETDTIPNWAVAEQQLT